VVLGVGWIGEFIVVDLMVNRFEGGCYDKQSNHTVIVSRIRVMYNAVSVVMVSVLSRLCRS